MLCHCRLTGVTQSSSGGEVDDGGGYACAGVAGVENVCASLNSAVTLQLLFKKPLKRWEWTAGRER